MVLNPHKFHELVDTPEGSHIWQMDHGLCETCTCISYEEGINIDFDPKIPIIYACIGEIKNPENPANHHEEVNTIRLCLNDDKMNVRIYNMTDWEVTRYQILLSQATSYRLFDTQRTPEEIHLKGDS